MTYSRVSVFTFTCCAYRKLGWATQRLNPIPNGLGHVKFIYGLIPPMAGRNRVKGQLISKGLLAVFI